MGTRSQAEQAEAAKAIQAYREVHRLEVMAARIVGEEVSADHDASVDQVIKRARPVVAALFTHRKGQEQGLVTAELVRRVRQWDCPRCYWRELQNRLTALTAVFELCQEEHQLDQVGRLFKILVDHLDASTPPQQMLPEHVLQIVRRLG